MATANLIKTTPRYDLTGKVFGRLTALSFIKGGKWLCQCECGRETAIWTSSLIKGLTKSCGCTWHAVSGRKTHGLTESAEYKVWCGVKRRCLNKNEKAYKRYGARGITICDRWKDSFENFLADMGQRPSAAHEIDRIDNDGNYEPCNCRWLEKAKQAQNRSSNHTVSYQGRTLCLMEWERETGIGWGTIKHRLTHGWSVEAALTTPVVAGRNRKPAVSSVPQSSLPPPPASRPALHPPRRPH